MKPPIHSLLLAPCKCSRTAAPTVTSHRWDTKPWGRFPGQNCYPPRRATHFITIQVNFTFFSHFIFLPNWREVLGLFFSFIFSFFLKGRLCCQKYLWTTSLFFRRRKWFIYFTVTSELKWQQGTAGLRAWGPAPDLGSWSAHGHLECLRNTQNTDKAPQGSEHTHHILFSVCPLQSPNFKSYWDSIQSKAAPSSLPGRQAYGFSSRN